jgi:hypothetical protein
MVEAFLPINTPTTMQWLLNVYFADYLHPAVLGHKLIASTIAYHLTTFPAPWHPTLLSLPSPTSTTSQLPPLLLPDPLSVSAALARVYTEGGCARLATTTAPAVAAVTSRVHGFSVAEDVAGKPGLLATEIGASITLRLAPNSSSTVWSFSANGAASFLVMVGYLASYDGMGLFDASVLGRCVGAGATTSMKAAIENEEAADLARATILATKAIDGLLKERVSIYATEQLWLKVPSTFCPQTGGQLHLWLEVVVKSDPPSHPRRAHKVKLLDVTWAPESFLGIY